jgi:hypothetical protein
MKMDTPLSEPFRQTARKNAAVFPSGDMMSRRWQWRFPPGLKK